MVKITLLTFAVLLLVVREPAAQQAGTIPLVENAQMQTTARARWDNDTWGYYKCTNRGKAIVCDFGITKSRDGFEQYTIGLTEFICTLTDNFKVDHSAAAQYFLNGHGQRQASVRLNKGDSVWAEVVFDGGSPV
jgi:hypothetical protein